MKPRLRLVSKRLGVSALMGARGRGQTFGKIPNSKNEKREQLLEVQK